MSLEEIDQRQFATDDPRGFLSQFSDGAIFDEVQRCPDLFSYLQTIVDEKKTPGLFILTGSQQFGLLTKITQSLAGRVGFLQLLPFTLNELQIGNQTPSSVEELLFSGLYPRIYDQHIKPTTWYNDYTMTYIERDVRQLINVQDLHVFYRFVQMCAARTGQILNLTTLASDCGITHNTAKAWLSVLEVSYILFLLQPHFNNFNKRLTKSPKLYFYDTGLACSLANIQSAEQLKIHPMRGALFETWVVSELIKYCYNHGEASHLYYWRDNHGLEVDILFDRGDGLIPIEVKSGQTIAADYFNNLVSWQKVSNQTEMAWLVYAGEQMQQRTGCKVLSWKDVYELGNEITK